MSIKAKLSLFFGIVCAVIAGAALVVYVDFTRSTIRSEKAEINAESYSVGTDHTGLISQQFVQEGDHVIAGQTLFQIKSGTLLEQLETSKLQANQLIYPLTEEGEILLKASRPGIVSKVFYNQGSFVPANSEVATIIDEESVKVVAVYRLARKNFAELDKSTKVIVRLPDGRRVSSKVGAITVLTQSDVVETEIEATLDQFEVENFATISGAPVDTTLYLKDEVLWDNIKSIVKAWF